MLLVADRIPLSVIESSVNVIDSEMAKIINADLKETKCENCVSKTNFMRKGTGTK